MGDTRALLQGIMKSLDESMPGHGITLLVFPKSGPKGARVNYVSNCHRPDMIAAIKEVVARLEGRAHDAPETRQ